jgi:hypothetical protein
LGEINQVLRSGTVKTISTLKFIFFNQWSNKLTCLVLFFQFQKALFDQNLLITYKKHNAHGYCLWNTYHTFFWELQTTHCAGNKRAQKSSK